MINALQYFKSMSTSVKMKEMMKMKIKKMAPIDKASLPHFNHCKQIKGIAHQFVFCRSNLIFWIVMGCGIADFGRGGL